MRPVKTRPGRNLSPYEWFLQMARGHSPTFGFNESTDFQLWKASALPEVLGTLGKMPSRVDPRSQLIAEWEQDGLDCQRWLIDVQDGMSAIAQVNIPQGRQDISALPAILCWHGHTGHGKEPIMGNDASPELRQYVAANHTDYGRQMAQEGFVTFAIDWMGQGDRNDSKKPNHRDVAGDRDWCNLYYLHATMLGYTPLGMNVAHGRVLMDFVSALPFVDSERMGVMGESGGGTLSLWTALCDERIRAVELICYSDLFADFGYRDANYCGTQVSPGLYSLVDLPDLQGLVAPRPLLVDVGVHDDCFRVESAMECHQRVRDIYEAAGASDSLELDLFPGGHAWTKGRSVSFFERHLAKVD